MNPTMKSKMKLASTIDYLPGYTGGTLEKSKVDKNSKNGKKDQTVLKEQNNLTLQRIKSNSVEKDKKRPISFSRKTVHQLSKMFSRS